MCTRKILLISSLIIYSLHIAAQNTSMKVEPFMPELIASHPNVRDLCYTDDEIYFTIQSYQEEFSSIVFLKKEKGKWANPQIASFSGKYYDLEPFMSNDGLRLYFASNRPTDSLSTEVKDFDIWYVERTTLNGNWSKPKNIGEPVNTKYNEFFPSLANNMNLYYTSDRSDSKGKDDIFLCSYLNGSYQYPISLSDSINTGGYEFNAFIAPDESYIIYTGYNRKTGYGSGDLYISYHDGKGNWTGSKNLGLEINSDKMDYCPFVDIKNNILYFTSKRSKVKRSFDKAQTMYELQKEFNQYENGLSRIYQVPIKRLLH